MNEIKNIALYARESTKWQAENGYNLEDQKKRMQLYVQAIFEENTYTVNVYEEAGASAKTLDRPMMKQLIADINANKITHCVVYSIDRLSRTITDLIEFVELLQKKNVVLLSVSEKIDTETPQGRFFLQLMGLLAQLERENISERTKRSLLESASQGNYSKASIPFGYKREADGKALEPDEEKKKIIRYIFTEVGKGTSGAAVAKELRENVVSDSIWSASRIYQIVKNPIYKGTYVVQGKSIDKHTEPLVSEEEWARANACIAYVKPVTKHQYLYRGKVFCKECGKLMTGTSCYNRKRKIYLYYTCVQCNIKISENMITDGISEFMTKAEQKRLHGMIIETVEKEGTDQDAIIMKSVSVGDIIYCNDIKQLTNKCKADGMSDETVCKITPVLKTIQNVNYIKAVASEKEKYIERYLDSVTISKKKAVKFIGKEQNGQ